MSRRRSPTTHAVADLLYTLGWRPDCDAQHSNLDKAIGDGTLLRALFTGERELRDRIDAEARP